MYHHAKKIDSGMVYNMSGEVWSELLEEEMEHRWLQRVIVLILSSRVLYKRENIEMVYIYYYYVAVDTLTVYCTGTASFFKINSNNNRTHDES